MKKKATKIEEVKDEKTTEVEPKKMGWFNKGNLAQAELKSEEKKTDKFNVDDFIERLKNDHA